ncbi:MAG: HhH-GPD-type base excision DNA repair protein, partial [Acidimicrobiia bacterium]
MTGPESLPWTESAEANRLLTENPLALLIGMLLDQQFPMERAFAGPYLLSRRLEREPSAAGLA